MKSIIFLIIYHFLGILVAYRGYSDSMWAENPLIAYSNLPFLIALSTLFLTYFSSLIDREHANKVITVKFVRIANELKGTYYILFGLLFIVCAANLIKPYNLIMATSLLVLIAGSMIYLLIRAIKQRTLIAAEVKSVRK